MSREAFLDFAMAGDGLRDTRRRVAIPIMLATVANENAAIAFDGPDQGDPFHETTSSSTFRMPGIWSAVMSL
jgi:hypothetical protein